MTWLLFVLVATVRAVSAHLEDSGVLRFLLGEDPLKATFGESNVDEEWHSDAWRRMTAGGEPRVLRFPDDRGRYESRFGVSPRQLSQLSAVDLQRVGRGWQVVAEWRDQLAGGSSAIVR